MSSLVKILNSVRVYKDSYFHSSIIFVINVIHIIIAIIIIIIINIIGIIITTRNNLIIPYITQNSTIVQSDVEAPTQLWVWDADYMSECQLAELMFTSWINVYCIN